MIRDKWIALGRERSFVGWPRSNENVLPDGVGRSSIFDNATIYWSPGTGAHPIGGAIGTKWGQAQYEGGYLGYPASDEFTNPDGFGKRQEFKKNQVSNTMYWSQASGAHSIGGAIGQKWASLGYEGRALRYPTGDELGLNKYQGRGQLFQGGVMYWSSQTGAHPIWGILQLKWNATGYETGPWGYPTSDEYDYLGGKAQDTEHGRMRWNTNMSDSRISYRFDLTAQAFSTGENSGKGVTMDMVRREMLRCYNCNFPIPGAPSAFPNLYQVLPLVAAPTQPAPVQVIERNNGDTFAFESIPGHFDVPGSTIRFYFYYDGTQLHLVIEAKIIQQNSPAPDWYYESTAKSNWQQFIQNVAFNVCKNQGHCRY